MPLANYGVLKGKAIGAKREDDESSPHYQVHILAGTGHNRIAVNSKSQSSPSELLFLVDDNFQHPLTARLPALGGRVHAAAARRQRKGLGLYPRQSLQSPGHESAAVLAARSGQ